MKKLSVCICCLLLIIAELQAQTETRFEVNLYKETKTFIMDGYTYQCDVQQSTQLVHLYNRENKWTYENQIYKNTGKLYAPSIYEEKQLNPIIDDKDMTYKTLNIINYAFTKDEVEQFGTWELGITIYLSPETGKVKEVRFTFTTFTPYAKVPVHFFREIEMQLKEQISYTPTVIGKQLNYIMLGWGQLPKGRKSIIFKDPDPFNGI